MDMIRFSCTRNLLHIHVPRTLIISQQLSLSSSPGLPVGPAVAITFFVTLIVIGIAAFIIGLVIGCLFKNYKSASYGHSSINTTKIDLAKSRSEACSPSLGEQVKSETVVVVKSETVVKTAPNTAPVRPSVPQHPLAYNPGPPRPTPPARPPHKPSPAHHGY